jgi:hypothetical protein
MVFKAQSWVGFAYSRLDKPELLTFDTVLLCPGWFINVDVRKVDFTDVKWHGLTEGPEGNLEEEIVAPEKHEVSSPYTLLAQAYRRLSANAEGVERVFASTLQAFSEKGLSFLALTIPTLLILEKSPQVWMPLHTRAPGKAAYP